MNLCKRGISTKEVILIKLKQQTKTLNEFLNIKNIKDSYLYTLDGHVMLFMKIFPINTDLFSEEELINHITSIMADDFEISDNKKAIEDLLNLYEKEKMLDEKTKILKKLENTDTTKEEAIELEKRLSNLIIQIAKMK